MSSFNDSEEINVAANTTLFVSISLAAVIWKRVSFEKVKK